MDNTVNNSPATANGLPLLQPSASQVNTHDPKLNPFYESACRQHMAKPTDAEKNMSMNSAPWI
jgi:hypothetical protein